MCLPLSSEMFSHLKQRQINSIFRVCLKVRTVDQSVLKGVVSAFFFFKHKPSKVKRQNTRQYEMKLTKIPIIVRKHIDSKDARSGYELLA